MSTITNVLQTTNQLYSNYDTAKLLLGFNSFIEGTITAAGGNGALVQGMVMGRVASTSKLTPLVATATDGSQFPVGVAILTQTVADAASATIVLVNKGRVNESLLNFLGAETLATTVGLTDNKRTIRDLLNDLGLELILGDEQTAVDNS